MARKQYLICYDIAEDKRRTAVFKMLMANGDHVQYSVFLCALNRQELAGLRGRLSETIHHKQDQIMIVNLGEAKHDLEAVLDCLGKRYNPSARVQIV